MTTDHASEPNRTGTDTVQREATFPAEDVRRILAAAQVSGKPIDIVKDSGAYLLTWDSDDTPVIAYADGYPPPPQSGDPTDLTDPDSAWQRQRQVEQATWGGDDFGMPVSAEVLQSALTDTGVTVRTTVEVLPWPENAPEPLFGGKVPLHRLQHIDILTGTSAGEDTSQPT